MHYLRVFQTASLDGQTVYLVGSRRSIASQEGGPLHIHTNSCFSRISLLRSKYVPQCRHPPCGPTCGMSDRRLGPPVGPPHVPCLDSCPLRSACRTMGTSMARCSVLCVGASQLLFFFFFLFFFSLSSFPPPPLLVLLSGALSTGR